MRVVAGKWRSMKLFRPNERITRPMPDRVKESVFSMLGSYYETPGALPALHVADVFAGSGSMGIESLSRGAMNCTFFESSKVTLEVLKRNLDHVRAGPEAHIVARDAWRFAYSTPEGVPFDLVFLDPPYRDSLDSSRKGRIWMYLLKLAQHAKPGQLVVFHHPTKVGFDDSPDDGWVLLEQRRFGTSVVSFYRYESVGA